VSRGRGRPRSEVFETCKASGCVKPASPGRAYCSRKCAPFGNYGLYQNEDTEPEEPKIKAPEMDPMRRELMLRVINDDMRCVPIVYQIDQFKHCDRALVWLLEAKITGHNLYEWIHREHSGSVLFMIHFIVKQVEKVIGERRLYAHEDLK